MAWNPQYCDVADLASWIHDDSNANNAELTLAIEAASRAVDKATNRQFGLVATPEARHYTAEYDRVTRRWFIDTDDIQTTVGLIVAVDNDGSGDYAESITDYALTPANAVPNGKPWTRIEVLGRSGVKPNGLRNSAKVTARYGWTTVPDAIKLAAMIQAARFYDRRDNVGGLLTKRQVDDVELGWSISGQTQELDPDVLASISAYRKIWAAA
jgi:hypothetical protein